MFLPQDESETKLANQKSILFKKDTLKPEKQATKKKVKQILVKQEPEKMNTNKIQNLSVNTLMEGMFVLGCVREIYPDHLSLSLPGGVFGRLYDTFLSPVYKPGFKKKRKTEVTPSFEAFQVGQMLCCRINIIHETGDVYPEVLVSTTPKDVNCGRSHSNVKVGDLLIVSVKFKKSDGYVMYSGIQKLSAFLKDTEAVKYIEERNCNKPLVKGQIVRCIVKKTTGCSSHTMVELTANPDVVSGAILKSDITIEKLIPSARVKVIVKNVQQDGLEVKVLGCPADVIGYIELSHLQSCWSKPEHYVPGTELTATVIYVVPPTKMVFLSLKEGLNGIVEQKLKIGAIIDNAKVEAVTKEGIEVIIGKKEDELRGLIHLRHIDGNVDLENLPLKYPVGTELKTCVISFDHIRQIYICSLELTSIDEKYGAMSDVTVGDVVNCRVKEVKGHCAHWQLGQLNICAPYCKTNISNLSSWYNELDKELKSLVCRFISHLQERHRKQDYKTGTRLAGTIASAKPTGILVVFGGNVKGILPARLYNKYILGEDAEVMVLWQNLSNKLLYLQPVGTFLEDENVTLCSHIIGSNVTGRVLFSESHLAICSLLGKNTLAYVLCVNGTILPMGSDRKLIVLTVINHYIICVDWLNVTTFYKKKHLKVPKLITHAPQLKTKEQCCKGMGQIPEEENKKNIEDNCGSESNKQYKRKSEDSFIEDVAFSVTSKKLKNNSHVSNKKEINTVNIESKQKEMAMDGGMDADNIGTLKNKKNKTR